MLPTSTAIWKAYRIKNELPQFSQLADRIVLDAYQPGIPGGTGLTFDWQLLRQHTLSQPVMLAGGLTPDNVNHALKTPVSGLDLNSGVESAPGVKDPAKIATAFANMRAFRAVGSPLQSTQQSELPQPELKPELQPELQRVTP